ncbi:MAG: hypothetical protein H0X45_00400 [Planctomycetes bacterium]|nr:hypothetical protein [Planctomycetota bacterium]
MNHKRHGMTLFDWPAVTGLLAMALIIAAVLWNALVLLGLGRWYRLLPLLAWRTWVLMAVLLFSLMPLLPQHPSNAMPWWPAVFITLPAALWLMRWETQHYLWSLCVQIAELENDISTNGGSIDPRLESSASA